MTSHPDGESTTPAPDGDDSSDELPEQRSNPAVDSDAEAEKTLVEQLDGILHEFAQTLVPEQQDLNQTLAETSLKPAMGRARSGLSSLLHSGSLRPRKLQSNRAGTADAGTEDVSQDYVTLNKLGEGGMGTVHLARQIALGREVALKQIHQRSSRKQSVRDEFLTEAVLTGKLEHPNLVPIYEVGESAGGDLFYSMKNVKGRAWDDTIDGLSLRENLKILIDVCDAMAFAHAEGVIHRDLKPQNIMTGGFGEVLVLDWGMAVLAEPCEDVKASGAGTPSYMAPEMINPPFVVGPRSDVYLLGAILFRFLTGKAPHAGKSAMSSLQAVSKNEIVTPDADRLEGLDPTGELLNVALKAMATAPSDRYQTVGEFQQAVREFEAHQESLKKSIQAASEAAAHLSRARRSLAYQDFNRAVFGFEDAIRTWPGNGKWLTAFRKTQKAYAAAAAERGDYDLALSVLDLVPSHQQTPHDQRVRGDGPTPIFAPTSEDPHIDLRNTIEDATKERNARFTRIRRLRRFGVAASLTIAVLASVASVWINSERTKALTAKQEEATQRGIAQRKEQENEKKAVIARNDAVDAQKNSFSERSLLIAELLLAERKPTREEAEWMREIVRRYPKQSFSRRLESILKTYPDADPENSKQD